MEMDHHQPPSSPPPDPIQPPSDHHQIPHHSANAASAKLNSTANSSPLNNFRTLLYKFIKPLTPADESLIEHRLLEFFPAIQKIPDHPPYSAMIKEAVEKLNGGEGSSEEAISEYIKHKYTSLPWAHSTILSHHLNKLSKKGNILVKCERGYILSSMVPSLDSDYNPFSNSPSSDYGPRRRRRSRKSIPGRGRGRPRKKDIKFRDEKCKNDSVSIGLQKTIQGRKRGRPRKNDSVSIGFQLKEMQKGEEDHVQVIKDDNQLVELEDGIRDHNHIRDVEMEETKENNEVQNHVLLEQSKAEEQNLLIRSEMEEIKEKGISVQILPEQRQIDGLEENERAVDHNRTIHGLPPYSVMIKEAVEKLNGGSGSSEEAISEYIRNQNNRLPWDHSAILSRHLNKLSKEDNILVKCERGYILRSVVPHKICDHTPSPSPSLDSDYTPFSSSPSSSSSDSPSPRRGRPRKHISGRGYGRASKKDKQFQVRKEKCKEKKVLQKRERGGSRKTIEGKKLGRPRKNDWISVGFQLREEQKGDEEHLQVIKEVNQLVELEDGIGDNDHARDKEMEGTKENNEAEEEHNPVIRNEMEEIKEKVVNVQILPDPQQKDGQDENEQAAEKGGIVDLNLSVHDHPPYSVIIEEEAAEKMDRGRGSSVEGIGSDEECEEKEQPIGMTQEDKVGSSEDILQEDKVAKQQDVQTIINEAQEENPEKIEVALDGHQQEEVQVEAFREDDDGKVKENGNPEEKIEVAEDGHLQEEVQVEVFQEETIREVDMVEEEEDRAIEGENQEKDQHNEIAQEGVQLQLESEVYEKQCYKEEQQTEVIQLEIQQAGVVVQERHREKEPQNEVFPENMQLDDKVTEQQDVQMNINEAQEDSGVGGWTRKKEDDKQGRLENIQSGKQVTDALEEQLVVQLKELMDVISKNNQQCELREQDQLCSRQRVQLRELEAIKEQKDQLEEKIQACEQEEIIEQKQQQEDKIEQCEQEDSSSINDDCIEKPESEVAEISVQGGSAKEWSEQNREKDEEPKDLNHLEEDENGVSEKQISQEQCSVANKVERQAHEVSQQIIIEPNTQKGQEVEKEIQSQENHHCSEGLPSKCLDKFLNTFRDEEMKSPFQEGEISDSRIKSEQKLTELPLSKSSTKSLSEQVSSSHNPQPPLTRSQQKRLVQEGPRPRNRKVQAVAISEIEYCWHIQNQHEEKPLSQRNRRHLKACSEAAATTKMIEEEAVEKLNEGKGLGEEAIGSDHSSYLSVRSEPKKQGVVSLQDKQQEGFEVTDGECEEKEKPIGMAQKDKVGPAEDILQVDKIIEQQDVDMIINEAQEDEAVQVNKNPKEKIEVAISENQHVEKPPVRRSPRHLIASSEEAATTKELDHSTERPKRPGLRSVKSKKAGT